MFYTHLTGYQCNINDDCSWAAITPIDDIDKWWLLRYETN